MESTPRDMLDKPFYPPLFDAFPCFVHACQLLPTQNVTKHCRETVKAHLPHSGKQLAAEYAGCSNSHGAEDGGDAAPCSRRSQGGGACRLDARTCTRRGHPVASVAAAQPSALSQGRRANTAKRENLLARGRPRSPCHTLRERGASILRSTRSPPLEVTHARDGRTDASRVRPRRRVESW
eukprot:COSAG01_NODE_11952_length_1828_cov_15.555234_1_plen_180_part_00